MGWKKWPSWLKGGAIFLTICIITIILSFIFGYYLSEQQNNIIFFPLYPIAVSVDNIYNDYLISKCGTEDIFNAPKGYDYQAACWTSFHYNFMIIIAIILSVFIYFIIGSILGLIYGKLKSWRNN